MKIKQIRNSFDSNQCDATDVRIYGFKTTLFAGGMLSDQNKQNKWDRFRDEIHDGKVRIIRMKRNNKIEQALDVYWKLKEKELGLKKLKGKRTDNTFLHGGGGGGGVIKSRRVNDYKKLDKILDNLNQREQTLDKIIKFLNVPMITITYEDLKYNHRNTIRKLSTFLSLKMSGSSNSHPLNQPIIGNGFDLIEDSRAICETVENYNEFCIYYSKSLYAENLKDPCSPGVWDCCKCKPLQRMIFPNPL